MYKNSPQDVCFDYLMAEYVQSISHTQTAKLLSIPLEFVSKGSAQLKGVCESADGCPCVDRRLDLKLIITVTDTCKWMVILQMFMAQITV